MEFDVFPEKAQYGPNEPIIIRGIIKNFSNKNCRAKMTIYHMGTPVYVQEKEAAAELEFTYHPLDEVKDIKGYFVCVQLLCAAKEILRAYTAFDRAAEWYYAPRYGFLSDFGKSELHDAADIQAMNRFHLNVVQFYDWMYRHDQFFPPQDDFQDIMGKSSSMSVIREKIDLLHAKNMKAIAYGAVYGAEENFFKNHPDCALFDNNNQPMKFIDRIYLMDINRKSEWHNHILNEYRKAIEFGFDGIHMDQYGFPKEALSKQGEIRRLRDDFPNLINDAKQALAGSGIIFNAVNNWPVDTTAKANEDCVYIEVWSPNDTYHDLYQLIADAKKYSPNKQVILAAYLAPFEKADPSEYGCTAQLKMATIFSSGGFHLLLGEENGLLTQAYYSDYCRLNSAQLIHTLQSYYDFITAYEELLFGFDLVDDTRTYTGGINSEYKFFGAEFSVQPEPNHVWTQIRHNQNYKVIHLINFTGIENMNWNEVHPKYPETIKGITVEAQIPEKVSELYVASPDFNHGMCEKLNFERLVAENGMAMIRFTIPQLDVWSVVFIKIAENDDTDKRATSAYGFLPQ